MDENNRLENHLEEPRGYDIDELRYRRAYALARYEMAKMQATRTFETAKDKMPMFSRSGIIGKVLGSLNYLDYALIAFRIISKIRKIRKHK